MVTENTSKKNKTAVKTNKRKPVGLALTSNKRIYTKKLGAKIAISAKPAHAKKYHVIIGDEEKWTVVADGNVRATKVFDTKNSAIDFARINADKIKGEVVIHKRTGEIEERVSLVE